jgi:hypothetical protein
MQTVDIPLNHYIYRFRKLTYEESSPCSRGKGDFRKLVLQASLVAVSDLAITTRQQAEKIMNALPLPHRPVTPRACLRRAHHVPAIQALIAPADVPVAERSHDAPQYEHIADLAQVTRASNSDPAHRFASQFAGETFLDHTQQRSPASWLPLPVTANASALEHQPW